MFITIFGFDSCPNQMGIKRVEFCFDSCAGDHDKVDLMPFTGDPKQQWIWSDRKIVNHVNGSECLELKQGSKRLIRDEEVDVIVASYSGKTDATLEKNRRVVFGTRISRNRHRWIANRYNMKMIDASPGRVYFKWKKQRLNRLLY